MLSVSPGLVDFSVTNFGKSEDGGIDMQKLSYVLIVEGIRGATRQMLAIMHNLHSVATFMAFQAFNGYSVVFSAAIPRAATNVIQAGSDSTTFRKVDNVKELIETPERDYLGHANPSVIRILC